MSNAGRDAGLLRRQGLVPPEWSGLEPYLSEAEAEEAPHSAEEIVREIVGTLNSGSPAAGNRSPGDGSAPRQATTGEPPRQLPTPLVLPPIDKVQIIVAAAANWVWSETASVPPGAALAGTLPYGCTSP